MASIFDLPDEQYFTQASATARRIPTPRKVETAAASPSVFALPDAPAASVFALTADVPVVQPVQPAITPAQSTRMPAPRVVTPTAAVKQEWPDIPEKPFFRAGDAVEGVWDAVKGLGTTAPAAFYQLTEGLKRPDKYSEKAKEAFKKADFRNLEMQAKTEANRKAGKSSSVGESIREAGGSLGFSLGSMAAAIPASIAGTKAGALTGAGIMAIAGQAGPQVATPEELITVPSGAVVGGLVGGVASTLAASGTAGYRMAGAQFLNEAFQSIENESMKKNGRPMNEAEKQSAYEALLPIAKNTALWEAGPEAVGNAVTLGAGKIIFGLGNGLAQKFASKLATSIAGKVGVKTAAGVGTLAVEVGTETLTQVEQKADQEKAQAIAKGQNPDAIKADWSAGGVVDAFKEVAPQTLALMGLLGGAGAVAGGVNAAAKKGWASGTQRKQRLDAIRAYRREKAEAAANIPALAAEVGSGFDSDTAMSQAESESRSKIYAETGLDPLEAEQQEMESGSNAIDRYEQYINEGMTDLEAYAAIQAEDQAAERASRLQAQKAQAQARLAEQRRQEDIAGAMDEAQVSFPKLDASKGISDYAANKRNADILKAIGDGDVSINQLAAEPEAEIAAPEPAAEFPVVAERNGTRTQRGRFNGTELSASEAGITETYHTGNLENGIDSIDTMRETGAKQNKKGRGYGGFYVGPENTASKYKGTRYKLSLDPAAKVLVVEGHGAIERLTVADRKALLDSGVDVLSGKDVRGLDESVIINKNAIIGVSSTPAGTKTAFATPGPAAEFPVVGTAQTEAIGDGQDIPAGQVRRADDTAQVDGTAVQAQMPVQGVSGVETDQQQPGIATGGAAVETQDAVRKTGDKANASPVSFKGKSRSFSNVVPGDAVSIDGTPYYRFVGMDGSRVVVVDERTGKEIRAYANKIDSVLSSNGEESRAKDAAGQVTQKQLAAEAAPAAVKKSLTTEPAPVAKMGLRAMRSELQQGGITSIVVKGKKQPVESISDATVLRRALTANRANVAERARIEEAKRVKAAQKAKRREAALNRPQKGQFKSNVTYTQDDDVTPIINEINAMGGMRPPQWTKPGKLAGPRKLVDGNYDGIIDDGGKVAVPSVMGVFRRDGKFGPDQMLEALTSKGGRDGEAGFLPEGATMADMWDAIRQEVADFQNWRATGKKPIASRNQNQDQMAAQLAKQEAELYDKQGKAFDEANAELAAAIDSGTVFAPQADVYADGIGEDGDSFHIESAFVGEDLGFYYDLTSNSTGDKYTVPVDRATGRAFPVEADIEFDVSEFENKEATNGKQAGNRDGQEIGTVTGAVPGEGVQPTDGDRGGRDAMQRGEPEADAGEAGREQEAVVRAPEGKAPRQVAPAPRKPAGSLFGDEPFNLAGGTARNDEAEQAKRDAKRAQDAKEKAAKADMSLLGPDATGTEQAVFYEDPATMQRTKVVSADDWRIWLSQNIKPSRKYGETVKMFDTLRDGPGGEAKAIAFAAKQAGIEVPTAEAKPNAMVPQARKAAKQKPWDIAEENAKPYAESLRGMTDKELSREDKRISDELNKWEDSNPKTQDYWRISAEMRAIGIEQDRRTGVVRTTINQSTPDGPEAEKGPDKASAPARPEAATPDGESIALATPTVGQDAQPWNTPEGGIAPARDGGNVYTFRHFSKKHMADTVAKQMREFGKDVKVSAWIKSNPKGGRGISMWDVLLFNVSQGFAQQLDEIRDKQYGYEKQAAAETYKPVMTANSKVPEGLTYEQFKIEYENALKQGFKYTPKQAGFDMWSEQMANLADKYPDYEARIDAEADAPMKQRFGGELMGEMELPQGDGWTESRPGGLATSKNPVRGGIVDQAIVSKKWFAIPAEASPKSAEITKLLGNNEFDSRPEAFRALYAAVEAVQSDAGKTAKTEAVDPQGRKLATAVQIRDAFSASQESISIKKDGTVWQTTKSGPMFVGYDTDFRINTANGELEFIRQDESVQAIVEKWNGENANPVKKPAKPKARVPAQRAKVEVKAPTLNLSDEKQAKLKAIQDKLRANLKGRLGVNPMLDPENVSLAAQMAALYAEGGVKTFKQFANNVKVDMADAWDAIKAFLHGAWQTAGAVDDTLDDVSRTEAREVIAGIDKAAAGSNAASPARKTALAYVALIESGKTITKSEAAEIAAIHYGGTMASGAFNEKQMTDIIEMAVNMYVVKNASQFSVENVSVEDAKAAIRELETVLDRLPTQSVRNEESVKMQQFSTPPTMAYLVSWVAAVKAGDVALEPSAGLGGLASFAKATGATVIVNELSENRREMIADTRIPDSTFGYNAENLHALLTPKIKDGTIKRPTVVIMNPPFSNSANTDRKTMLVGSEHVDEALALLPPGGRLVAILGKGRFDDAANFKAWLSRTKAKHTVRALIALDGKGYKKYGTTFDNRIIVIDKVAPSADNILVEGTFDRYEDAVSALEGVRDERKTTSTERDGDTAGATGENRPTAAGDAGVSTGVSKPRIPRRRTGGAATGLRGTTASGSKQPSVTDGQRDNAGNGVEPAAQESGEHDTGRTDAGTASGLTFADGDVDTQRELGDGVFSQYSPTKARIDGAIPHPTPLVESTAMAAIELPNPTYTPNIPAAVITSGTLSDAQLEQVVYAGQAHGNILPSGERAGHFTGDGTGVGKGRIIAGIMLDNWRNGRKKAVWVSKTGTLINDARRDVTAVFGKGGEASDIVIDTRKGKNPLEGKGNGIAFLTYSSLSKGNPGVSPETGALRVSEKGKESRIQRLVEWLGKDFDGVIVFDEAHLAGNAIELRGKRGKKLPSERALAVVDLQRLLPKARIEYVSATGATDITNLSYADRLGLWGPGKPFPTKRDFFNEISAGGLSAMEIVAQNLKAMGRYLARTLSFQGVDQRQLVHKMTPDQLGLYDEVSKSWQIVMATLEDSMASTGANNNSRARSAARSILFGAQQRFYNQMLTAMHMPSVIDAIDEDLKNGHAAVIQLVNTNEATQERAISKATAEDEEIDLETLDLSPKDLLLQYVQNSFPTAKYEPITDDDGNTRWVLVVDENGAPVQDPTAVEARDDLLLKLQTLKTPQNPLEMILDHFGAENVAEITGRSRRIVYKKNASGNMEKVIERRSESNRTMEAQQFQDDKRRILMFSDAGGTGFSFHSDKNVKNQRRRMHYLVQAGWRADSALQGFGRTHRSNQEIPPYYALVSTDIKGHQRFISTIARRLAQLGAITSGERKAASGGLFNESNNLENDYAEDAVNTLFKDLFHGHVEGFDFTELTKRLGYSRRGMDENTGEITSTSTLIDQNTGTLDDSKIPGVAQFLNRILILEVDEQNRLFDFFMDKLNHRIEQARFDGTFDPGMQLLDANEVRVTADEVVYEDPETTAKTRLIDVDADEDIDVRTWSRVQKAERFVKNRKSGKLYAVSPAPPITSRGGSVEDAVFVTAIIGPRRKIRAYEIRTEGGFYGNEPNFTEIDKQTAKSEWEALYAKEPKIQTVQHTFVSGAYLPIWDRIGIQEPKMWRVPVTATGQTFLGVEVPQDAVGATRQRLNAGKGKQRSASSVFAAILNEGEAFDLANGWRIIRSRIGGESRIEVKNIGYNQVEEFRSFIGGYTEKRGFESRFFIPTEREAGIAAIDKMLVKSPILEASVTPEPSTERPAAPDRTPTQSPAATTPAPTGTQATIAAFLQGGRTAVLPSQPAATPTPRIPAPRATGEAKPEADIVKQYHDKRGKDIFILKPKLRMERYQFTTISSAAKAFGGWYSRQWGKSPAGFAFTTMEEAKTFAAAHSDVFLVAGKGDSQYMLAGETIGDTSTAEQMETQGKNRRQIWDKTGWYRGVDGKWRFEIDDSDLQLTDRLIKDASTLSTQDDVIYTELGRAIRHDNLFNAYPGAQNILVSVSFDPGKPTSGTFIEGTPGDAQFFGRDPEIKINVRSVDYGTPDAILAELKSIASHEVQHWIQSAEGFARGGSPQGMDESRESVRTELVFAERDISSTMVKIERLERLEKADMLNARESKELSEARKTLAQQEEYAKDLTKQMIEGLKAGTKAYRLLSGEAESRVVQRRLTMTTEQRKAEAPWETMEKMLKDEGLLQDGQKQEDVLITRFDTTSENAVQGEPNERANAEASRGGGNVQDADAGRKRVSDNARRERRYTQIISRFVGGSGTPSSRAVWGKAKFAANAYAEEKWKSVIAKTEAFGYDLVLVENAPLHGFIDHGTKSIVQNISSPFRPDQVNGHEVFHGLIHKENPIAEYIKSSVNKASAAFKTMRENMLASGINRAILEDVARNKLRAAGIRETQATLSDMLDDIIAEEIAGNVYAKVETYFGVNQRAAMKQDALAKVDAAIEYINTGLVSEAMQSVGRTGPPSYMAEYRQNRMGFYSAAERAVEGLKQDTFTPEQLKAQVAKAPGVKAQELEDTGFNNWLDGMEGKVTKWQAIAFLQENGPRLQEVVKGDGVPLNGFWSVSLKTNTAIPYQNQDADVTDMIVVKAETKQDALRIAKKWDSGTGADWKENGERVVFPSSFDIPKDLREGKTKFGQYQIPGGENYREVLLTLPKAFKPSSSPESKAYVAKMASKYGPDATMDQWSQEDQRGFNEATGAGKDFTSSHWSEPNVLAHFRLNDRTDADGRKTLFIEEIQSDLHQKGREKGYNKNTDGWTAQRLNAPDASFGNWAINDADGNYVANIVGPTARDAIRKAGESGVPDAPFKGSKSWAMLSFKRILRMAAEQGYDSVAWTPGSVQNDRYSLDKQLDALNWGGDAATGWSIQGVKDDDIIIEQSVEDSKLDATVGKEVAERIRKGEGSVGNGMGVLVGDGLKIGGDGMKGFYDNILPKEVQKYVSKLDKAAKVGTAYLKGNEAKADAQSDDFVNWILSKELEISSLSDAEYTKLEKEFELMALGQQAWSLPITDKMRSTILNDGQALYMLEDDLKGMTKEDRMKAVEAFFEAKAKDAAPQAPKQSRIPAHRTKTTQDAAGQPAQASRTTDAPLAIDTPAGWFAGIRNSVVDREFKRQGLDTPDHGDRRAWGKTVMPEAERIAQNDPGYGERLTKSLMENPRIVSDLDNAILAREAVRLKIEVKKATESEDPQRQREAQDKYNAAMEAWTLAGTPLGQALAARAILLKEDYSLAEQTRLLAVSKGRPLTAKESESLKKATDRIAQLEADLERIRTAMAGEKATSAQIQAEADKIKEILKGAVAGFKGTAEGARVIKGKADDARARIAARKAAAKASGATNFGFMLDETGADFLTEIDDGTADYALIGADLLESGVTNEASWRKQMLSEIGPEIESQLDTILAYSYRVATTIEAKASIGKGKSKPAKQKDVQEKQDDDIKSFIRRLVNAQVESGVIEHEAVMNNVTEGVQIMQPGITRQEVGAIFSDYGVPKYPSADATKKRVRELRRLEQLAQAISDANNGITPMKSGAQRDSLIQEIREKMRELRVAMKDNDISARSFEDQLASSITATTNALSNQIDDLTKAIKTKMAIKSSNRVLRDTEEIIELRQRRDALRLEYDAWFPKAPQTPEQRLNAAIKGAQRRLEDYQSKVVQARRGVFPSRKVPMPLPESAELDSLQSKIADIQDEIAELKEAAKPKISPEERELLMFKRRVAREIEKAEAAIAKGEATGDWSRPPRKETLEQRRLLDQEATEKALELAKLRRKLKHERMPPMDRILRYLHEAGRFYRSIKAGADASYIMRQGRIMFANDLGSIGLILKGSRRAVMPGASKSGLVNYFSEVAFDQTMKDLDANHRDSVKFLSKYGLYTELDENTPISRRVESGLSDVVERLPWGIGWLYRAGNRSATTISNLMAVGMYENLAPAYKAAGELNTEADERRLAKLIGDYMGRAVMPRSVSGRHLIQTMSDFAFSARFALARGRSMATLYGILSKSKAQRQEGFRTMIGTVVGVAGVLAIMQAINAAIGGDDDDEEKLKISFNPFSADFMKMRAGNTRMDLLSGETQWVRFLSRFIFGKTIDANGELQDIDRGKVLKLFVAGKQAPIVSLLKAAVLQESWSGRKLKTAKDWIDELNPAPLWLQDGYEVFTDQYQKNDKNWAALVPGIAASGAAWLGQSVQTYDSGNSGGTDTEEEPQSRQSFSPRANGRMPAPRRQIGAYRPPRTQPPPRRPMPPPRR